MVCRDCALPFVWPGHEPEGQCHLAACTSGSEAHPPPAGQGLRRLISGAACLPVVVARCSRPASVGLREGEGPGVRWREESGRTSSGIPASSRKMGRSAGITRGGVWLILWTSRAPSRCRTESCRIWFAVSGRAMNTKRSAAPVTLTAPRPGASVDSGHVPICLSETSGGGVKPEVRGHTRLHASCGHGVQLFREGVRAPPCENGKGKGEGTVSTVRPDQAAWFTVRRAGHALRWSQPRSRRQESRSVFAARIEDRARERIVSHLDPVGASGSCS